MLKFASVIVVGVGLCATAVQAAEMSGADIKTLISGNTVYLSLNAGAVAGAGDGVIFYNTDGTATYKTPSAAIWHGSWVIKDNTVCIDWKELPNNPCTRYEKDQAEVTIFNTATGKPRGKITKVAPGNPEKL